MTIKNLLIAKYCEQEMILIAYPYSLKTLYATLLFPRNATCPSHLILLGVITRLIFGEQYSS
jgi:hypothetical protein